jgi:hypothetical protein
MPKGEPVMARERNNECDYPAYRIGQQWHYVHGIYANNGDRPMRKSGSAAYCDKVAYFSNDGAHVGKYGKTA